MKRLGFIAGVTLSLVCTRWNRLKKAMLCDFHRISILFWTSVLSTNSQSYSVDKKSLFYFLTAYILYLNNSIYFLSNRKCWLQFCDAHRQIYNWDFKLRFLPLRVVDNLWVQLWKLNKVGNHASCISGNCCSCIFKIKEIGLFYRLLKEGEYISVFNI